MRELSVPPTATVGPDEALTDMVARNATEHPGDVGLRVQRGGRWIDVTHAAFAAQVADVAKGLVAGGVQAGDRVGAEHQVAHLQLAGGHRGAGGPLRAGGCGQAETGVRPGG